MSKDILGELRNIFIEAIASHKLIEMKYGRSQTDEINRLKQQYLKVKNCFKVSETSIEKPSSNQSNSSKVLEKRLDDMEKELCLIKIKLIEQQKGTSQIINQIEKRLAEIKLFRNTEDVLSELELQMLLRIPDNIKPNYLTNPVVNKPQYLSNPVVDMELDSLRKQLDEL